MIGRISDGTLYFDLRTLDDEAAFVAQLDKLGVRGCIGSWTARLRPTDGSPEALAAWNCRRLTALRSTSGRRSPSRGWRGPRATWAPPSSRAAASSATRRRPRRGCAAPPSRATPVGQRNLALCYYEGWGVPQDQAEAARWYEKAAGQGDADAQDMLSWMKLLGGGCPQDYPGARGGREKAAAQGRASAMARLGDIHHNALGVERDPAAAAEWWRRAARLGHAEAQAMLGAAHLAGKGVARDPVEALHWLLRAEAGGAGELAAGFLREARAARRAVAARRGGAPGGGAAAMIVGTAGHIDHGKTALVKALTGVDADRLKEEKARGITIDLGYAYSDLGDGRQLGFVDVPGHERFVHNMLAGATGIDAALLVVSAAEGIKPQTVEHLQIVDLLGLDRGIVALTKADLADDDQLLERMAEVETLLAVDLAQGRGDRAGIGADRAGRRRAEGQAAGAGRKRQGRDGLRAAGGRPLLRAGGRGRGGDRHRPCRRDQGR